jgi:hypothetical protein
MNTSAKLIVVAMAAALGLSACSKSSEGAASPGTAPSSASVSPTPTSPPPLGETRLQGVMKGLTATIKSNVDYGTSHPKNHTTWTFKPACETGACDEVLTSSAGYKTHLSLTNGAYEGQVVRKNNYACGTFKNDAIETIRVSPISSKLLEGQWLITNLKGTLTYSQKTKHGNCTLAHESFLITLKLTSPDAA